MDRQLRQHVAERTVPADPVSTRTSAMAATLLDA
jgi:hypothetical protein